METTLPQMAASLVKAIYVLRVSKVRPADRPGQRCVTMWYRHKVNVIAHQTITDNLQAVPATLLFQKLQIHSPVFIYKEDILLVVTPLGNMMGKTNRNCSR